MPNKTNKVLISLRNESKLKQKEVAEVIGITTSYYGMIEQGTRNPTLDIAHRIAAFYKKSIEEIFFANEYNKMLANKLTKCC
ncbi:helix-turn-helix transcriptional regulator [Clostridium sp. 19966]|uniref:helix-turn-helix transcriptional regulator n=1 Tax=Clostridium sp. 19966 TaxID=2768166 RepID=UPI0028DDDCE9|nr:helix-turn-helix transcriptional regulator [Clostridium sp. 19966]MDT8717630.1 helix-turn-helix transcriptional regulator [Clostridium sp. 19966]